MKSELFFGSITALITPFSDGRIDYSALGALIEDQIEAKIPAVVIAGTTGEAPSLSTYEFEELINRSFEMIGGRMKMIVGTGSPNKDTAERKSKYAASHGADALLVVTPYYNKGTEDGTVEYYKSVCAAAEIPIILYNVPSRTGVDLNERTLDRLCKIENIKAIKEAGSSIDRFLMLHERYPDLTVFSGNDTMTLPAMALGADGVISVVSNAYPKLWQKMCELALNDKEAALSIQTKTAEFCRLMFSEVNPAPIKCALSLIGKYKNDLRVPLTRVSKELEMKIKQETERIEKWAV